MGSKFKNTSGKIRDKAWVRSQWTYCVYHGIYARFNYVAQPEDNVVPPAVPREFGRYDKMGDTMGVQANSQPKRTKTTIIKS